MIRLASNSTFLGLVEPFLVPPQKIHRARILNKIMIEKRITDELEGNGRKNVKLAKKPKPTYLNGNVIDLHPYLNDPYWEIETPTSNGEEVTDRSPLDYIKKREGIMRVASVEDEREFYGGLLSPVYKQDYLESLPLNKLKELFDQYLRDMSIG